MAVQKPLLNKGRYIEYADDPVKVVAKDDSAVYLAYADEPTPTTKSGFVPKTELEKNNYAVYRDTPYEPEEETLPPNYVAVLLTNPVNASNFRWCKIYDSVSGSTDPTEGYVLGEQIASITDAAGYASFAVNGSHFGFIVEFQSGVRVTRMNCTRGVDFYGNRIGIDGELFLFKVVGNGSAEFNGNDYGG